VGKEEILKEIREALIEWAILRDVWKFAETREFIEDLLVRLGRFRHESCLENVRLKLVQGKGMEAIRQSITLTEEQHS
jgi:hypothetical protein